MRHCCGIAVGILAAALLTSAVASTEAPERKIENNIIMSARDPEVRIGLPKSVLYVGADRWILYGIADCELHGFVDVDPNGKVERIYWVQFEGYIPEKPELKYQYTSPRRVTIGDMEFILDTGTRAKDEKSRPGSDREHLNALIAAYIRETPHLRYIETYDMVLGPDGKPRPELFVEDQLHFNAEGYKLLAERVRPVLSK